MQPRRAATAFATVDLPEADGPSIATMLFGMTTHLIEIVPESRI